MAEIIEYIETALDRMALSCLGYYRGKQNEDGTQEIINGAVVINGVALPQHVIEELRQLGTPISWFTASELLDAIEACHMDLQLIDDHDGVNFRDKLKLTYVERINSQRKHRHHLSLFCDKVEDDDECAGRPDPKPSHFIRNH